jgi:hypothetical protein
VTYLPGARKYGWLWNPILTLNEDRDSLGVLVAEGTVLEHSTLYPSKESAERAASDWACRMEALDAKVQA